MACLNRIGRTAAGSLPRCTNAVMLGFKQFRHAAITIAGIELMHRIHQGQFGYDDSVFEVELRPRSGMQCSEHEGSTLYQGCSMLVLPICTGTS